MAHLFFGGSFNPIHVGHLICARAVAEARGYDRVVLVPSAQPPHKPDQSQLADAQDRLAMVRAAIRGEDRFLVDDIEMRHAGPNYTIETVRRLKERGEREVHWLIGADMLAILPSWHRAEELIRAAKLVILSRPGWHFDWDVLPEPYRGLRAHVVEAPLIDLSATGIRRRVREGRSIRWMTPDPVVAYIEARGLYRATGEG